jgi:hypothetical protein
MATIAWLRSEVRERSGRYDLTTTKIDGYINDGQRYLDRITQYQKAPTRFQSTLAIGAMYATFPAAARVVMEVWAGNTDSIWRLDKATEAQLRELYPGPPSVINTGTPAIYCADPLTYYNASGTFQYYAGAFDTSFTQNGVLIMPPPDTALSIEVRGRFYSPTLTDTQGSWWLSTQADILLRSALRAIEVEYRNSAGRKDWEQAIASDVASIEFDDAEEEGMDIDRMEG